MWWDVALFVLGLALGGGAAFVILAILFAKGMRH
jgi:hypothetical protein